MTCHPMPVFATTAEPVPQAPPMITWRGPAASVPAVQGDATRRSPTPSFLWA